MALLIIFAALYRRQGGSTWKGEEGSVANPNYVRVILKREFVLETLFSFPVHSPWLGEEWPGKEKSAFVARELTNGA